jgi:hypothetical protein
MQAFFLKNVCLIALLYKIRQTKRRIFPFIGGICGVRRSCTRREFGLSVSYHKLVAGADKYLYNRHKRFKCALFRRNQAILLKFANVNAI